MLRIHHLNCGCMRPIGGRLLPSIFPSEITCHCLLIETSKQLILIDSGLGVRDAENPSRLGPMAKLFGIQPQRTTVSELRSRGFSPSDVTDVIPTHLDFDHSGGVEDLPQARVHITAAEYQAAFSNSGPRILRERYKRIQFSHDVQWQIYETPSEWNGFAAATELRGLPAELVAVRLPGHTPGHVGIAVKRDQGWLLHAGDAYYDHRELEPAGRSNLALSMFQRVVHTDFKTAVKTQKRISELPANVQFFCAHDPVEFARYSFGQI